MFGAGPALSVDGKEVLHRDADNSYDLRLTRAVIRELKGSLLDDQRVRFRRSRARTGSKSTARAWPTSRSSPSLLPWRSVPTCRVPALPFRHQAGPLWLGAAGSTDT